jgi:asparagine synthase (glutamine-hydrolysing)
MLHQNWPAIFESFDAGVTGVPLDHRHPLLDLRLVEFFLSLPAIPWCVDKHILRASARNRLPNAIRKRSKAPLPVDPMSPLLREYLGRLQNTLTAHPDLGQFVNLKQFPAMIDEGKSATYWFALRGLILNQWLAKPKGLPR